jgi:glucosylceramidase
MSTRTRRDFLKVTATAATAVSSVGLTRVARAAGPAGTSVPPAPAGGIDVRVTAGDKRYAAAEALRWRPASGTAATILLDPEAKAQPVLGFGGAFTDAACWTISQMPEAKREALLAELFDPKQLGLGVCRTCIGSSDYARNMYSYDEGEPDPELKRFSIEHDLAYILPTIRRARALNPNLFLLGSPWSPPGWMKDNNSMIGGTIRTRYLDAYGNYFVKFLEAYKREGVEVNAVTSQNEVDTEQDSRMPACLFPQEVEVKFIATALGPAIEKSGLGTKIWMIDHNYNLWGRAIAQLDDPTVNKYSKTIAWHGYVGQPEWMQKVVAAHPDVEMHWTEGGPDYTDPKYLSDWAKWGKTFAGILRNGARSIIAWNLALDEVGKPNIGPFPCGGVVTVDSKTHEVTRSGQYWALAHYSRAIRRDARVIGSQGTAADVDHVAVQNPDGRYALILTNGAAAAQTVTVQMKGQAAEVHLPADSVTTLVWG